ncbi:MAG: hypothetical protein J0I75_21855, partial [Hyphomicrobium sp.]|nr:hypothetical protein [Hyphomicrobium sp.]
WQWSSLVDPEDESQLGNIRIHGITPDQVAGEPKWPQIAASITNSLLGQVLVSHTNFDQIALSRACARYGLELPDSRWLDSRAAAREAWPQLGTYGLRDLCEVLDIELQHHDALSDARACGLIFLACLAGREPRSDRPLSKSLPRTDRSQGARGQLDHSLIGRSDGPLRGHVVVFTGEFEGGKEPLSRLAAAAGCSVDERFRKKSTTILVVGHRDPSTWGSEKSRKQRDAEEAIAEGRNVEVMTEEQFRNLLGRAVSSSPLKTAI